MKRIFSVLIVLCFVFGMTIPALAAEPQSLPGTSIGESGESISETAPEDTVQTPEEVEPEIPAPATPTELPLGASGDAAVKPFSGFEGEDSEFFTRIRLTVTDRDGNPIPDAVYGLYRMGEETLVEYLTTDHNGIALSGDVPVHIDYYLREEYTPKGFLPNEERKDIILSEVCAPSRIDVTAVYDPITGYIQILKWTEDEQPLPGAGFYIYRQDTWEIVATLTTGSDGTATTGLLPYGQYEIYEYDVPEGFSGAGWNSVFLEQHGETQQIKIFNYKSRGSVRIHKSGEDERNIQGAVFSIYEADSHEWLENITTNSSGYAYSSPLLLDDYYAVEKSVPAPYKLSSEKHLFTVSSNGQTVYLNLVNSVEGEPGKVKVLKTDGKETPLSGVVFGLYRSWDNKKLAELTTAEDGTTESGLLIPGSYYLVELTGKPGYETVTGQIPFTVDGSGDSVKLTVENPKIRMFGKVKVIKKDDFGTAVPGARFGVYCYMGNLLEELVTGPDGTATSGILNEGSGYYLMELEGVPGYLADLTTKHSFDITVNNAIVSVNIINPRISGSVKVIKDDAQGNPLPGVVFGIYKEGSKIEELTTSEDGTATSGTLFLEHMNCGNWQLWRATNRWTLPFPSPSARMG